MRALLTALLGFCGVVSSGCAICSPGFLDDYAAVGGKWERNNPTTGRVGSILSDPNSFAGEVYESRHSSTIHDESEYYPSDRFHYEDSDAVMLEEPGYEEYESEGIIILGDQW